MAYTYNRKNNTIRKMPRRKTRRRRKAQATTTLPLGGFPKNKLVKLRYVTECVVQCAGLSDSFNFRANGMFDPDHTGVGHQPKAFDQWMSIYNHYNVLGAKINVKLASTHGADNYIWGVTRTPAANQMDGKQLTYCLENRYNKGYRTIGSSYNHSGQRTNANSAMVCTYSQKKQFGKNSTGSDKLTGTATTDPTEQQFFEVWIAPINSVAQQQTASFIVTIDYIALLTEPRVLAQS